MFTGEGWPGLGLLLAAVRVRRIVPSSPRTWAHDGLGGDHARRWVLWLPVDPRVATWVGVASSFGWLGSRRLPVQQPPRRPATTTPPESAPAGGTATARVPVAAELRAAGRGPLRSFHFASVVLHFECRIDRQSSPTPAPTSRTLAESSRYNEPLVGGSDAVAAGEGTYQRYPT